ncbi:hypothetical protein OB2597_08354 [Pseudooceanicola batsensis HTCC2597]|uniref:Uncharacterized protein n=1 Tax=Pseudooceanicola batsensis (strain ATCC BAA-863 / DSM 15984 / KCTC 12145 / HTCC2597) TaxID=252305 RepID=A3TUE3_PSEBH|nr:hypothetical protein [Pseudooceanicola batsensis]EAQ04139.1 hypothetical protein OB2597_08354 [Pseudooceanicola batsensis HTCC2597]
MTPLGEPIGASLTPIAPTAPGASTGDRSVAAVAPEERVRPDRQEFANPASPR